MYNRDTFINELMKAVDLLEREMSQSEAHKSNTSTKETITKENKHE